MGKYKTLVCGENDVIIDDLFLALPTYFDCVTSSSRQDDLNRHIEIFEPEIFMICINNEDRGKLMNYVQHKRALTKMGVPVIVIGTLEACELFESVAPQMADLYLHRPIKAVEIRDSVLDFMDQLEAEKEEQAEMKAHLEEVKKKDTKKHVLIIDDDPIMLKLIKEYLGDQYEVGTAISGKIGLRFIEKKQTDMILLDYEMPEMKGPEVLTHIRENPAMKDVPIVFLTGVTEKSLIMEVLQLKPQGYLVKPIDKEKLLGTVEKYIGA